MSIPDLEVEANAPDMNDARAEGEAIPETPAFELQEAHAPYAILMARKKSAQPLQFVRSNIRSNSRRNPFKTIALPNAGCSTWTWSTSKQNALDTGYSILNLFLKCFPTCQLVTTFTPNLLSCTCSPWSV